MEVEFTIGASGKPENLVLRQVVDRELASTLTEAIAQVGAILILAKPENRSRLPLFAGIQKVRYRKPVHPGDVMEIEATVIRLRNRMGILRGIARVNGVRVIDGTMTFALAPAQVADAPQS